MRLDGFPSLTDGFVEFIEFMVFFLQGNEDDVDGGGSEERMRLFVNRSFDCLWDRKFGTADGLIDTFILLYEYHFIRLCFLVWFLSRFYRCSLMMVGPLASFFHPDI